MILTADQISEKTENVGMKTKNLARLKREGFCVPEFVVIPSVVLSELYKQSTDVQNWHLQSFIQEIKKSLPADFYAVRSSALIEDSSKKSYAGQFLTKIKQSPDELEAALKEVIGQALEYLHGDISKFSLIIQRYIEADYSGVTFTRDPAGGREMVLEYHQGKGEELVGGLIKPDCLRFYWNQSQLSALLPDFINSFENFKKIEKIFGFAQDIEWAIKDGMWYFLQSRLLTTLSQQKYEEVLFLDRVLPAHKDFFFEKTEISEIAPRPSTITKSLLEKIYTENGPVQKVYKKYGIRFQPHAFLKIIGNELYIDRNEELQTLLPAYSYLENTYYKPHFAFWKRIGTTFFNMVKLTFISLKNKSLLQGEVLKRLEKPLAETFEAALQDFMNDYETIFEVNFLAQKSLKSAEVVFQRQKSKDVRLPSFVEVLYSSEIASISGKIFDKPKSLEQEHWLGNSLELMDETPFSFGNEENVFSQKKSDFIQKWFDSIASFQKKYLLDVMGQARFFTQLREAGRWLTVRHVHHLRAILQSTAKEYNSVSGKDIFFADISEITSRKISPDILQKRRQQYEQYLSYTLPPKLTGKPFISSSKTLGVSRGQTEGILTDLEHLASTKNPILFTSLLSPNLMQYFGQLKGIISEQGGLLSHLAIVARESQIPVIVKVDLNQLGLKIGDKIEIDGATGVIKKIL